MAADREELQRIAQMVEVNRERMQAIEQQLGQLESIHVEQIQAIEALQAIPEEGAQGAMIPLGSGVQIIADIPSGGGAVVDIGSRVQAERTREEAADILSKRSEELAAIIERMKAELNELEQTTVGLAQKFNENVEGMQPETITDAPEPTTPTPTPRRSKRKRGTDLTLDD
ncbi:MAG: prefoldin subunit alpha [Candidatus Thalassarchaeaceae archaeon]|jgi:prefoldin alpha subunit|nr:prefoldin subunit alpha [Candidatus Thalassarchaeaceae archaeon]MDP6921189.1 prefoldin subunit alpha [Candidatus Thalassarchaeum sp.]